MRPVQTHQARQKGINPAWNVDLSLSQLPPFWIEARTKIMNEDFSHFMISEQLARQYKFWLNPV